MARMLGPSWRTTVGGLGAIAGGIAILAFAREHEGAYIEALTLIGIGVSLIQARDKNA